MGKLEPLQLTGSCGICGEEKSEGKVVENGHCSQVPDGWFVCVECCQECHWWIDECCKY